LLGAEVGRAAAVEAGAVANDLASPAITAAVVAAKSVLGIEGDILSRPRSRP
jgi:hypothetical protein